MPNPNSSIDTTKFINPHQVGGIDRYALDEGEGRGVRALCVNTGGGLRYRVLADRGLDIDQAFFNQHSLTFLSYKGVTRPTRALDRGLDWLKGFAVGLLTSCGPFGMGAPGIDQGEELGLHGPHSNTAASIESITQPDPHRGQREMKIVAKLRYGAFYGPNVELKRTIRSTLGENAIRITDEFYNAGNQDVPHAWLLHINLGWPLVDEGGEFCYDAARVDPLPGDASAAQRFAEGASYKQIPAPLAEHSGSTSFVGYIYPKSAADGRATVGVINPNLGIGLAIRYNTTQFSRCANWQHWGRYEYVAALEPSTGSVEGRAKDREYGLLQTLKAGASKRYDYEIEVLTGAGIDELRQLNR